MEWTVENKYQRQDIFIIVNEYGEAIATCYDSNSAKIITQAVNNMPRNPYLPLPPDDGQHRFSDSPSDIGGNYRCRLCGAYNESDEANQPCFGEFKESGKMRVWAQRKWDEDLAPGNAFKVVDGP